MDRKVFMGVVQIFLDYLDFLNIVIGWYKLFISFLLVGYYFSLSTIGYFRKGLIIFLDSGYNNNSFRMQYQLG